MEESKIIIYQTPDGKTSVDVKLENDTVWLNRHQLSTLFGRDIKTIGKHINNALNEELKDIPVVAKFATTAGDGKVDTTYRRGKVDIKQPQSMDKKQLKPVRDKADIFTP